MTSPTPSTPRASSIGGEEPDRGARWHGRDRRRLIVLTAILVTVTCILIAGIAIVIGLRLRPTALPARAAPGTSSEGAGSLVRLTAVGADADRLPANRFCERAGGGGLEVVECEIRPMVVADAERCTPPGAPDPKVPIAPVAAATESRCAPADQAVAAQLVGWVVSRRGREQRVSLYVGPTPAAPTAVPDSVPREMEATLLEKFRAVDTDGTAWSELAVCPVDVDGDGLLDVAVQGRPRDAVPVPPDPAERASARPEVVVFFPDRAAASPAVRQFVRSYRLDSALPRDLGRGCESPLVTQLRMRDGRLELLRDAVPAPVVTSTTRSTTTTAGSRPVSTTSR